MSDDLRSSINQFWGCAPSTLAAADGTHGVIVDTRTGEFWTEDGNRFQPREARITLRHPAIDNQPAKDDSNNKFMDCLEDAVTHHQDARDCVAQQKFDFQPDASKPASTSNNSQ